ncbi:MAG TPA: methyltransferase domain-containing protein [Caulobacteraceae bacterium]|nr:methyltransferase domain-containing protein [Caulobacteraceae bacterium]
MSPRSVRLARSFGRQAFGEDPANYDAARPDYPDWVFEELRARCGLGPGSATFEVGAGTGKATRPLLAAGADPLYAIEPDARLAAFLSASIAAPALHVVNAAFEDAQLPRGGLDLGLAATSFHWVDALAGLNKVAGWLRPGGWWSMVWNVFGDESRPDPFHDATDALLRDGPKSPSQSAKGTSSALSVNDWMSAFGRSGAFEDIGCRTEPWELVIDPDQVVALYSTYSNIAAYPPDERRQVLAELRRIAADEFDGHVVRNMITILYTARRRA